MTFHFQSQKKYQITLTINLTEKKYRAKREFNTSVVTGNINQYNMYACMKTYICRYDSLKNYFLHLLLSLHAIHKFDDVYYTYMKKKKKKKIKTGTPNDKYLFQFRLKRLHNTKTCKKRSLVKEKCDKNETVR